MPDSWADGNCGISIHALREEGDGREVEHTLRRVISIHALREEGDHGKNSFCCFFPNFYPRPPRGGRQHSASSQLCVSKISIHALREEGDSNGVKDYNDANNFYPRPPRGGRLDVVSLQLYSI